MFGHRHSVTTILKQKVPHLLIVRCSCHTINLVSEYATRKLPDTLEWTIKKVYSHFSKSSDRQRQFREHQQFHDVKQNRILSPGQTRWLTLEKAVDRVMENILPLIDYFRVQNFEHPNDVKVREIFLHLTESLTEPYLEFLRYVLNRMNEFNTEFQSESPFLYRVKRRTYELIEELAQNFMEWRYVKDTCPTLIDPELEDKKVPMKDVYLGNFSTG